MKSHTYSTLLSGCPVLCPVQETPVSLSPAQGRGELKHLPHGCHSAGRLSECYHLLYLPLEDIDHNTKGTHRIASGLLKPLDGVAYLGTWAKPGARFPVQAVVTLPLHVCQPIRASRDTVIVPSLQMKMGVK